MADEGEPLLAVARGPDVASMPKARLHLSCGANRCPENTLPARLRRGSNSNQAGFALVAVIWSLGLIMLLGTAVIVDARYRTKTTSSLASVTATTAAAESAINLGIMTALTAKPDQIVKFPLRCRMPGGEQVTVTLEEEAGKVDLNTATPAVLARLFTALTLDQTMGTRIAGHIVQFRDPGAARANDAKPRASSNNPDTKKIGFTTIMQLDQIDGISPGLFKAALRFVTVRSGRPEPVAEAASPALREALNLNQKPAAPSSGAPAGRSVTFRADVIAPDGTRFIREALISFAENGRPYLIREWRHGDIDSSGRALTTQRRDDGKVLEDSCFRIGGAVGS
jgi:general secretion pathway protein K